MCNIETISDIIKLVKYILDNINEMHIFTYIGIYIYI